MYNQIVRSLALCLMMFALVIGPAASAFAQDGQEESVVEGGEAAALEGASTALPDVQDVRVSNTPQRARLIIDLSNTTAFAIASLSEPNRIAVDVRAASVSDVRTAPVAGEGLIESYTVELAEPGRARTLLTLAEPAQVQQAYLLDAVDEQPARLVVDFIIDTPEGFAARVAEDLAAYTANPDQAATPTAPGGSAIEAATLRPLVVIDPGHGGIDNGASTPSGIHEKNIVLDFALRLQDVLVEAGRFDVALTRSDDSFLRLEDRVALARENRADLFISLHADSFQQPEIRGASVYTRDENATDILDRIMADRENKVDIIAGFAMPEMTPAVVDILVDLMRRETRRQSFTAADAIIHQLEPAVELRRFPLRQADFFVLQAPDVPSILVELGFLSNADDISNLLESGWRDRVVDALARGISTYFDGLEVAGIE
ncbi:N-acetylmuramoyl-L-alanine amidase [Arsenicitalea aurantiaca]|uniref:N-acetylmuramoyl-L-alanine amidase n=1 Tax=Arsenicitalea aurantiaca TaxID=1783274 RepID=UPI0013157911|nr:N-acetylmuramoyl-L-alanine amidase [Arsenicitalea aurantiaca]